MKRIIWVGVFPPSFHSVGDHAQTLAISKFLKEKFPDYDVIKLCKNETHKLGKIVKKEDLIFLHSQGNFGSKYHFSHRQRKDIIDAYPNNMIVQLPVSVYYEPTEEGRAIFEEDRIFFSGRDNLLILCRTPEEAELLRSQFNCRATFFPDFVFYLKPKKIGAPRKGILFVLRNDQESLAEERYRSLIKKLRKPLKASTLISEKDLFLIVLDLARKIDCKNYHKSITAGFENATVKDVQTSDVDLTDQNREEYINEVFAIYQKFQIVITDRFHGAVFSQLTQTPCIAIEGKIPHKITGCRNILPDVVIVKHISEIPRLIQKTITKKPQPVDLSSYFDNFRSMIFTYMKSSIRKPENTPVSINPEDLLQLIKNRRSIRKWTSKPVEPYKIRQILLAGLYAPSAANTQAVQLLSISNGDALRVLCQNTSIWFKNSQPAHAILVLYDTEKAGTLKLKSWQNRFIWQDSACSMQNMMIAAEALGLKSCFCSANPEKGNRIKKLLKLKSSYIVGAILFLGYSEQTINERKALHMGKPIQKNPKRIKFFK